MPPDSPTRRLTRAEIGSIGERLARTHLETRGYRILDSNYRCRWGEVDLVALQDSTYVFVEVRTRHGNAFGTAEESITPQKAKRLTLTAQHYLEHHNLDSSDIEWRIDLVAVRLGPGRTVLDIHHVENAISE